MLSFQGHRRSLSMPFGLRFKSDGEKEAHNLFGNSLPRGELSPSKSSLKINKNLIKLDPINHKRPSIELNKDSLEQLTNHKPSDKKHVTFSSENSDNDSDSQSGSSPTTPKMKKQSLFAGRKIIDVSNVPGSYTPVIGKKKTDLYRISILSQFTRKLAEGSDDNSGSEDKKSVQKPELVKVNSEKRFFSDKLTTPHSSSFKVKTKTFKEGMDLRKLVFSSNIDTDVLRKHLDLILRGLNYALNLLKAPPTSYIHSKQINLRELKKKNLKTLVLDLDETLITTCTIRDDPDKVLTIEGEEKPATLAIKIRPYTRELLNTLKEHYEIMFFTAGNSAYAEAIAQELDPEKKIVSYILDRRFCLETKNGFFIKDLRLLKNRLLKNIIIVDNLVHSFGFQIENGVPILEWNGNKKDVELKYLIDYLLEAKNYDDVRECNRERFRLMELSTLDVNNALELL